MFEECPLRKFDLPGDVEYQSDHFLPVASSGNLEQRLSTCLSDEVHIPTFDSILIHPHHHHDYAAILAKDTEPPSKSTSLDISARLGLSSAANTFELSRCWNGQSSRPA